jgi:hypothetical protein
MNRLHPAHLPGHICRRAGHLTPPAIHVCKSTGTIGMKNTHRRMLSQSLEPLLPVLKLGVSSLQIHNVTAKHDSTTPKSRQTNHPDND